MTTDTAALVAFVSARLDEDEATAKPLRYSWVTATDAQTADFSHHFDAKRMLREVEAKRRLIDEFAARSTRGVTEVYLATLATAWSDHPDYRQEWKP